MPPASLPGRFRMRDVWVNPALDEIHKDGITIKVEPRTMRLLVCLAEQPGEVVSVEQLLDRVWKDVVVSPDSVYAAVASLRRTLGDDPKQPAYIANVMRRGYRLVAPVSPWPEDGAPSAARPPTEPPPEARPPTERPPEARPPEARPRVPPVVEPAPKRRWSGTLWLAAAALVVLAIVCTSYYVRHRPWPPHESQASQPERSVAVLPFLDLSEKQDEQYFADGMSEELIDLLARLPELKIPARTSSFYFKGKQATIAQIAKTLGVTHVLEGSVRKSGDTLRITAQLVRADTGYHLWSKTFDRPFADIFKIQDEIAADVVRTLQVSLLSPDVLRGMPTESTAAYALLLKARSLSRSNWTADIESAAAYVQQSLLLDPRFASAWAELATLLVVNLNWYDSSNSVDRCNRARIAAQEALRLDDSLPDGHRALGHLLGPCFFDWQNAAVEFRRALDLAPDDARTLRAYADLEWYLHHSAAEMQLAQQALALDPLNTASYFHVAMAQSDAGNTRQAAAMWRKAIEIDPTQSGLHALLTNVLLAAGDSAAAFDAIQREPDKQARAMNMPFVFRALGRHAEAAAALASYIEDYGAVEPLSIGEFYACEGQVEPAIDWLQRAASQHEIIVDVPNRQACFKSVERDARYQKIRHDMHLDEN